MGVRHLIMDLEAYPVFQEQDSAAGKTLSEMDFRLIYLAP